MHSKDIVLLGLAAWLLLRLTSANAATQRVATVQAIQPTNSNADLWLKTGALSLGSQLIRELGKGVQVFPTAITGAYDGFGLGTDIAFSEDSGGYW